MKNGRIKGSETRLMCQCAVPLWLSEDEKRGVFIPPPFFKYIPSLLIHVIDGRKPSITSSARQ